MTGKRTDEQKEKTRQIKLVNKLKTQLSFDVMEVPIKKSINTKKTTEQTSTTMEMNFKILIEKGGFKKINSKHYSPDAEYLYQKLNGLHYYIFHEPKLKWYSLMRTNYKIKGIIFTGHKLNKEANINCYMREKDWEEPEGFINEYASIASYYKVFSESYSRNQYNENLFHYTYDVNDNDLIKIHSFKGKIPDGYFTTYTDGSNMDFIMYEAPHLQSISEEEFNTQSKQLLDIMINEYDENINNVLTKKNSKMNDNCIDSIIEYL